MSGAPRARLLVVEDEVAQRAIIAEILRSRGFLVTDAASVDAALTHLASELPDLIVSDWKMPGRSGGELLDEVRARELPCAFIVMTAYGSIAHAVEAMHRGADDYLAKPFEREALLLTVERALRARRLEEENRRLRRAQSERDAYGEIRGRAPVMQRLYQTLDKVAPTDATVLLIGESGTGKELLARTLHTHSRRAPGPFVAVNCAAIPETLMESELFGHERGAFTGAERRRAGRFEEADGGTLFLDEIASMPLPLQAAVLRVLQEKRFTRVGGTGEASCDVRIVAASNRDLPSMVASGAFRDDLYYRLNVVAMRVPALRERREDVPLLAAALLERAAQRHGMTLAPLPPTVLRPLLAYPWPGNVRELANVIERLVVLAEGATVSANDLPDEVRHPAATTSTITLPAAGLEWDAMEADLIRQALERSAGNRAAAAKLLGLGYKAFLYRLEKHGVAEEA